MVLGCPILVSEFRWCFALHVFVLFLVRFWVADMSSLCVLAVCGFGCFPVWCWGWVWVLVASVPGL